MMPVNIVHDTQSEIAFSLDNTKRRKEAQTRSFSGDNGYVATRKAGDDVTTMK